MADEARLPDAQLSRALLIGVSEFTDDQLLDLPSVRHNLTGLFEVLTSPWGAGLPDTGHRPASGLVATAAGVCGQGVMPPREQRGSRSLRDDSSSVPGEAGSPDRKGSPS